MTYKDVTTRLRRAGFVPIRKAKHGWLWMRGRLRILVPREGNTSCPRARKNLEKDLQRIGA